MVQYHILVSGRVQGVGFRYFVQMEALSKHITGWVKNLNNGSVEIMAVQSKQILTTFIEDLKKGNHFAAVHQIDLTEQQPLESFSSFNIVY
ncbi:MAG: acylphosphatase [Bacillus sp. (in: firmicutes)]